MPSSNQMLIFHALPMKMIRKYGRLVLIALLVVLALYTMTSHVRDNPRVVVKPDDLRLEQLRLEDSTGFKWVEYNRDGVAPGGQDAKRNNVLEPEEANLKVGDLHKGRNAPGVELMLNKGDGMKHNAIKLKKEQQPRSVTAPPDAIAGDHVVAPTPEAIDNLPHDVVLDPSLTPNTVYYVWCGRRWFEFVNYLSVISVMRYIRPDNVIFYYDNYPVLDYWLYNTWFNEIVKEFPFFRPRFVNASVDHACAGHELVNITFVHDRLSRRGGLFMNENTILDSFPIRLRRYDMVNALDTKRGTGFILSRRWQAGATSTDDAMKNPTIKSMSVRCAATIAEFNVAAEPPFCVAPEAKFFPKDIWTLDSDFGRMTRKVFYGRPEVPVPRRSFDNLAPNIAHIVWIGGGSMDFLFYLCVLSLIYVAKVDVVYIHGDYPPTGMYWQRLSDHRQIKLIFRETPRMVYRNNVNVISHVSDIWRVDFMLKYGGVYVDTDTVFVRELDANIRSYDAVGSYDWTDWNSPFPDTINFGVAIGKRNATYWHLFQESMRWFIDRDWSWNGLRQPYKVQERHPDLVRIDPHLQVICFEFKCHPTWWPNYHNESIHHVNSDSIRDWRTDVYAFHWTLPTPHELRSEENLIKAKGMFADIGRFILEKAGLLKS